MVVGGCSGGGCVVVVVYTVQVTIYTTNLNTVQVTIYTTNLNKYSASNNLHH